MNWRIQLDKRKFPNIRDTLYIPPQPYFDLEFEKHCNDFLNDYRDEDTLLLKSPTLEMFNSNITEDEIVQAVRKLKNNKAPGLDFIKAECIKDNINFFKKHLQVLFNYILNLEDYPVTWAEGLRIAIPKGEGDIRPITIEPIFGKIFETIIDMHLTFLSDANGHQDAYNGGFVKGSQTQETC